MTVYLNQPFKGMPSTGSFAPAKILAVALSPFLPGTLTVNTAAVLEAAKVVAAAGPSSIGVWNVEDQPTGPALADAITQVNKLFHTVAPNRVGLYPAAISDDVNAGWLAAYHPSLFADWQTRSRARAAAFKTQTICPDCYAPADLGTPTGLSIERWYFNLYTRLRVLKGLHAGAVIPLITHRVCGHFGKDVTPSGARIPAKRELTELEALACRDAIRGAGLSCIWWHDDDRPWDEVKATPAGRVFAAMGGL